MSITLRDFWVSHDSDFHPSFKGDVAKSCLLQLVRKALPNDSIPISITSVYKRTTTLENLRRKLNQSAIERLESMYGTASLSRPQVGAFNIWYTPENIRPPLSENWDFFLSYELDDYYSRNQYLPLWFLRLDPNLEEAMRIQNSLTQPRDIGSLSTETMAAVVSHPERIRQFYLNEFSRELDMDVFGKMGRTLENKKNTLEKYNFNVCFENDLYPGYVTEKPVEAYLSGCIPVWRGIDAGEFLNKEAIIDVTNLSLAQSITLIRKISNDPKKMMYMKSQPLLRKNIDISEILSAMQERLSYW